MTDAGRLRPRDVALLIVAILLLTALDVGALVHQLGIDYIETRQLQGHEMMLAGEGGSNYKYRLLAEVVVEGVLRGVRGLGVPSPVAVAFIGFECCEVLLLYVLAALWYRRLGLSLPSTLLGLAMVGWGMTNGTYDSALSFDTLADVLFYLAAGLLLCGRRYGWVVLLTVFAAFNRETSGMIPCLLAAEGIRLRPQFTVARRPVLYGAVALALWAAIFVGLRLSLGMGPLFKPDGHVMGPDLLQYNLGRVVTWVQVIGTVGVTPVLAAVVIRHSPGILQRGFWVVVPFWFIVHFSGALIAEARLIYVPFIMFCVPAVLFWLSASRGAPAAEA